MSAELTNCVLHGVRVQGQALPLELLGPSQQSSYDRTLTFDWVETLPVANEPLLDPYAQGPGYCIGEIVAQGESALCFRYFDCCEFRIQRSTATLQLQLHPGTDLGIPWMIFENSVIGAWLALQGQPMLHAAAVVKDERAWLFAGPSGAGKTTLSLLCCHAGTLGDSSPASLLSDDAVRLRLDEAQCFAFPGTRELRLRENAEALGFGASFSTRRLPDERLGVSPRCAETATQVGGIFVPTLGDGQNITLTQLFARDAMLALLSAQRSDWTPRHAAFALGQSRALLERVPVFRVSFPQGTLQSAARLSELYALLATQMAKSAANPQTSTFDQGSA